MKEFKGTPGPWFEHREGFSTVYVEARIGRGMVQEVAACGPTEKGTDAQYANARLISVAPELLKELQRAVEVYNHLLADGYLSYKNDSIRASEIIAKALGE